MTAEIGDTLGLLGRAFEMQQRGQFAEAEALYAQVLASTPDDPTALVNAGANALARGDHALAIARLAHAARLAPRNAIVHNNLGLALLHAGRAADALASTEHAIMLQPRMASAHNHRGIALAQLRRNAEARAAFGEAIACDPKLTLAALNFGEQANNAGDHEEAAVAYERVLAIEPHNMHAATGRAFATALSGDLTAAARSLEATLNRAPQHAPAWQTLGAVRNFAWDHEGAEAAFLRALALAPGDPAALFGLASARLGRGDFALGWEAFEQRPDRTAQIGTAVAALPVWDGSNLEGTLLIYGEQGFGDVLQFARFVARARQRVRAVVLLLAGEHAALAPLLRTLAGVDRVITRPQDLPDPGAMARVSILSLPHRLGIAANELTMTTPYLRVPEDRRMAWAARIDAIPKPRVGLAWSVLARDVNGFVSRHKSIPATVLAPMLQTPAVSLVTLQPGTQGDPVVFGRDAGTVRDIRALLIDFADTAAVIAELDLVISADTAVAHLAGALGKPVWMLDRFNTCWRWRGGVDEPPWYPSMRVFRQTRFGDWSDVATRVGKAFSDWRAGL